MFRACNFISPLVRPAVHKFRSRPPLFLYLSVRSAAMLPIYRRGYSMSTIIISYSLFAQQKAAVASPRASLITDWRLHCVCCWSNCISHASVHRERWWNIFYSIVFSSSFSSFQYLYAERNIARILCISTSSNNVKSHLPDDAITMSNLIHLNK